MYYLQCAVLNKNYQMFEEAERMTNMQEYKQQLKPSQ